MNVLTNCVKYAGQLKKPVNMIDLIIKSLLGRAVTKSILDAHF